MNDINVVKERVIEELKKQGIDVYFIDFYVDDGEPYFVYTFEKSKIEEAAEYYKDNLIVEGAFDDWSFFKADESDDWLVRDICYIIKRRRRKAKIQRVRARKSLIEALRRLAVQTGPIACLDCGYAHNYGIHGCALVRAAIERLEELTASPWISVDDRLPEDCQVVLVIANGRPREHVSLVNSYEIATFFIDEGWYLDEFPDWEQPQVTFWMPLPDLPREAEPGLYHKYRVYDNESGASIDGCFVLRPDKDFAARDALRTYAATTSNRILSKDIINFLESLKPEV